MLTSAEKNVYSTGQAQTCVDHQKKLYERKWRLSLSSWTYNLHRKCTVRAKTFHSKWRNLGVPFSRAEQSRKVEQFCKGGSGLNPNILPHGSATLRNPIYGYEYKYKWKYKYKYKYKCKYKCKYKYKFQNKEWPSSRHLHPWWDPHVNFPSHTNSCMHPLDIYKNTNTEYTN